MKSNLLRKAELVYELKIRGLSTEGKADLLRQRLTKALKSSVPVDEKIVNSLDPETELSESQDKVEDLQDLVEDFDGDKIDQERITTRLECLYCRVERIPLPKGPKEDMEELQRKKEDLLRKTKQMMDSFKESAKDRSDSFNSSLQSEGKESHDTSTSVSNDDPPKVLQVGEVHQTPIPVVKSIDPSSAKPSSSGAMTSDLQRPVHQASSVGGGDSKTIPIYKWGLQFSNSPGQSVGAFLQRVEELRRARGISEAHLFQSAVDLFTGSALIWYRSTVGRISSWDELCKEMKVVFQTPDYDDMLIQEIMSRKQGDREAVDLYIASMEGLYSRLSMSAPENDRLKQMLKNLNRYLQEKLCMFPIETIEELRQLGRKAELGRLRASNIHSTPKTSAVLEPDLAYQRNDQGRHHVGKVSYVNSPNTKNLKCWNCGEEGHRFMRCSKPRTVFCFSCGAKDVKKVDCPKCRPKNE